MEISEIKQNLKLETVIKHYGLKANRNNMLKCPFHEETEPSLKIYPQTNTFNGFGCKANGDATIGSTSASWTYDSNNMLSQIAATGVQRYDYSFDVNTGT